MRILTALLSVLACVLLPTVADAQGAKKKGAPRQNPVAAAYAAMPLLERIAIQTDLIWTGDYNGIPNGDFADRAIAAVKAFQRRSSGEATGILAPAERTALAAAAKAKQEAVGWRVVDDLMTGA